MIDSPEVAADFTAEFEQMFDGRFGYAKYAIDNGNYYRVGDTDVEVYFSPQEDAMGRILEGVQNATESVEFFIFAFTKDQLGSRSLKNISSLRCSMSAVIPKPVRVGRGIGRDVYGTSKCCSL